MSQKAAFLALAISLLFSLPAFADDWVIVRMRGTVHAKADSGWQKLKRGAIIPDDRQLRTSENGHIELVRGNETLVLQPNTQIRISDRAGAKPYTIVSQDFGTVQVEAEAREVAHFEVRTDVLAAVVKGTKFVVTAGQSGARVDVKRGHVYVEDTVSHSSVVVAVGQQASFAQGAATLEVDGRGNLPTVVDRRGDPVGHEPGGIAAKAEKALADAIASGDKRAIRAAQQDVRDAAKHGTREQRDATKAAERASKADDKAGKADDKPVKHVEKNSGPEKGPGHSGNGNGAAGGPGGNDDGSGGPASGNGGPAHGGGNGHGGGHDSSGNSNSGAGGSPSGGDDKGKGKGKD